MSDPQILIVDDSHTARMALRITLEGAGYKVAETCSSEEALTWLEKQRPKLIITDFNMDGMNGLMLVERVRTKHARAELPILVLTTETSDELKIRGRNVGADGWLVKPFQPARLCAVVGHVLSKGAATP